MTSELLSISLALVFIAAIVVIILAIFLGRQIAKPIINLAKEADILATGNLTVDMSDRYTGEIGILHQSLKTMTENFRNVVQRVQEGASHISIAAEQLTASTEESSASVEQVASAIQEMTKGIDGQASNSQEVVGAVCRAP